MCFFCTHLKHLKHFSGLIPKMEGIRNTYIYIYMCSCLTSGGGSFTAQMGGSFGCRRRVNSEPFEEPEPAESSVDSPVSTPPQSATGLVEVPAAAEGSPRGTPAHEDPAENFRVGNQIGSLESPQGINWSISGHRVYCVWVIPFSPEPRRWAGIHWGRETDAYSALITLNNNSFSGLRWQRCDSFEIAVRTFFREGERHQVDTHLPLRVYRWQLNRER